MTIYEKWRSKIFARHYPNNKKIMDFELAAVEKAFEMMVILDYGLFFNAEPNHNECVQQ